MNIFMRSILCAGAPSVFWFSGFSGVSLEAQYAHVNQRQVNRIEAILWQFATPHPGAFPVGANQ
jgi:hypothetical protein